MVSKSSKPSPSAFIRIFADGKKVASLSLDLPCNGSGLVPWEAGVRNQLFNFGYKLRLKFHRYVLIRLARPTLSLPFGNASPE
jgi:hypothetical protein